MKMLYSRRGKGCCPGTSTSNIYIQAVLLALLATVTNVQAGIQTFDLTLLPTNLFVHYNSGFIRSPGSIDLSGLTFTAVGDSSTGSVTTDDGMVPDTKNNNGGGGGNKKQFRLLDGGSEQDATAIDIAIFALPNNCSRSKDGCDWAELGIGRRANDADNTLRWCCSDEAIQLGLCTGKDGTYGRLIIDSKKFHGDQRYVTVPMTGPMSKRIRYGLINLNVSATYVALYANCNDKDGREVHVTGQSIWKSVHGYLPGESFGFMYFYTFITIIYFLLFFWFGTLMHINEDHRIEIEKWILFAITLGLLEMIFRTGDYFVWNADGVRSSFIIWIGILSGVLKQGISRCLLVMVSLGWGVVRDTLGRTINVIIIFGIAYFSASVVTDLLSVYEIEAITQMTYKEEKEVADMLEIVTFISAAIDAIFIVWILDALGNTMVYLETMNQTRKLQRFLKLRLVFLFSVLFAVAWTVFALVDKFNDDGGIVTEEHAWTVQAAVEVNYLCVLIGVAYLWRPNESAREYAYVMELPSSNSGDLDDYDNDIELSAAVPSAMDDDDDDNHNNNHHHHDDNDNNNYNTNGFHDETPKEISRFEIS